MSRFRRIGLAATAAAAVLALAIVPSASAISINTGPSAYYNVTNYASGVGATFFSMPLASTGGSTAVQCYNSNGGMPVSSNHGWGIADGQARTLFVPAFQQPHPTVGWGCFFRDHDGSTSPVTFHVTGALALALTDLAPGQNPSSPRRRYNGRLFFYQAFSLSFAPEKYPGCYVRIAGPQSVDIPNQIVVDDNKDQIDTEVINASFAATKTAACPSTIGDSVSIFQSYGSGWRLNNVTVTP
ncbi:MAG: hypothetical protein WC558_04295 [Patulibacter sp.]